MLHSSVDGLCRRGCSSFHIVERGNQRAWPSRASLCVDFRGVADLHWPDIGRYRSPNAAGTLRIFAIDTDHHCRLRLSLLFPAVAIGTADGGVVDRLRTSWRRTRGRSDVFAICDHSHSSSGPRNCCRFFVCRTLVVRHLGLAGFRSEVHNCRNSSNYFSRR